MPFVLRVTFEGLCAIVDRELAAGEKPQGSVLLVNARGSSQPELHDHTPRLRFFDQGRWTTRQLDRKQVIVELDQPSPAALDIVRNMRQRDAQGRPIRQVPDEEVFEECDGSWVAPMYHIAPEAHVDDACFDQVPPDTVAACLKFTCGHGFTSALSRDPVTGDCMVWELKAGHDGEVRLTQALAIQASLTAVVLGQQVRVKISDFAGPDEETLTFTAADAVAGEVLLKVSNDCEATGVSSEVDHDFAWYYQLCPAYSGPRYVPHRRAGGSDVDPPTCPPSHFGPNQRA